MGRNIVFTSALLMGFLCLWSSAAEGQSELNESPRGVVVETVELDGGAAKGGLQVGDILLQWSRRDRKGEIESPFVFEEIAIEQGPRGPVALTGLRGGQTATWQMDGSPWRMSVRPNLAIDLLTVHSEARRMDSDGKYAGAAESWERAATLASESSRDAGWLPAWFLREAAGALGRADRYMEADALYEKSIEKLAGGSHEEAFGLYNLGETYYFRAAGIKEQPGDIEKAETYLRRALEAYKKLAPGSLAAAQAMDLLGGLARVPNLSEAEEYHRHAFLIRQREAPDSLEFAASLANLGMVMTNRGDLEGAETNYRIALKIIEKVDADKPVGSRWGIAIIFRSLGTIAFKRGDLDASLDYYKHALAIEELAPAPRDLASILTGLSLAAFEAGDLVGTAGYCTRAIAIAEKIAETTESGLQSGSACMMMLGEIAFSRGDFDRGNAYYARALPIFEKLWRGSLGLAYALNKMSMAAYDQDQVEKAEEYEKRALAIQEKHAPQTVEHAQMLGGLARIMLRKGNRERAAELYAQALNAMEAETTRLGGSEEVRSGFRARHLDLYREYVDLLIQQKQTGSAFQAAERSQARGLLETLAAAHVNFRRGGDPALLEKERMLQDLIAAKLQRRIRLLTGEHTEEQVARADKEITDLRSQYQEVERQIRVTSPAYAALTQPQPLTADAVRKLLPEDTLLLEYSLGNERSFAFAVTAKSLNSFVLPPRAEIEEKVKRLYRALTERSRFVPSESDKQRRVRLATADAESRTMAVELSRILLGPLAAELGERRLLIVGDGALQYVSFAALPAPGTLDTNNVVPLIARHEIVVLPSASVLGLLQREGKKSSSEKEIVVLADPVFDRHDARVRLPSNRPHRMSVEESENENSQASRQSARVLARSVADTNGGKANEVRLPRLIFTRDEARAIMATVAAGRGMQALGFDANRQLVTSDMLKQYRVVHFATHALIDNIHPELSGLVLSLVDRKGRPVDGYLELQDIYNLELSADLVVLSACQTALGKQINGEGMIGLTRGFMYAGAPRVMATLWKVDDFATSRLMARFYTAMEREGMTPAQALRQAQIALWKEQPQLPPYYWAGVIIQGDWR